MFNFNLKGHDESDLGDIRWQEHFPEKTNSFFTKLGPYGSQVLYSDMVIYTVSEPTGLPMLTDNDHDF